MEVVCVERSSAARLALLLLLVGLASLSCARGADECPGSSPGMEAIRLVPCMDAAQNGTATPSAKCCSAVKLLGKNPACLCAVMQSDMAKMSGIKPEIAITIPKRCNISNRPKGYKCGDYTLP